MSATNAPNRTSYLLTGGASRRMGQDKAGLIVDGQPLGLRLARLLAKAGWAPTVLGREPLPGYAWVSDSTEYAGPLSALRAVHPLPGRVAVVSCDVPLFRAEVVQALDLILDAECEVDAIVPSLAGRWQPLCAVYRSSAWAVLADLDSDRVMAWLDRLNVRVLDEDALVRRGLDPRWMKGVNSPSELAELLGTPFIPLSRDAD